MHSSDARKILLLSGFSRDDEIYSNYKEFYRREVSPIIFFIIPKEGYLSYEKEKKLLEILKKIEVAENG